MFIIVTTILQADMMDLSPFPTIQNQAAEGWNYGSSASLWAVTTLW